MSATLADNQKLGIEVLNRLIRLDEELLTPDAARTLLSLKFDRLDERRMNQLAAKARRGTLTDREQAEADQYNLVSHMVALLQAKSRGVLRDRDLKAVTE